jgi:hypothetical protein
MPLPRLLRRLSEKNFRKRTQSLNENAIESEPVPPLPPPQSPHKDNTLGSPPQGVATIANSSRAPPHPNHVDDSTSDPRSDKAATLPTNVGQRDNVSDGFAELWTRIDEGDKTQASKADKALGTIGLSTSVTKSWVLTLDHRREI